MLAIFNITRTISALRLLIASVLLSLSAPLWATSINIGTVAWVGYGPFYVADKLGMFKKAGLDVKIKMFTDPVDIPPAIAGGSLQGGMVTYSQVFGPLEKGQVQKVVLPLDFSYGADAIVASTSVKSIEDFKGKKIGLVQLSPSDILLSHALRKHGLTEKDVTMINMAPDAVAPAMTSGQLAIGVTWEPMLSQLLAVKGGKSFHVLYSSKEALGVITDVLVFDERFIKANGKDIQTLIKVYLDALAYIKSKPDDAAKIVGKTMSITPKEVKEQMALVKNPGPAEILSAFDVSDQPTSFYGSGPMIAELLKSRGEIKQIPSMEATLDATFVRAVIKK